MSTFARFGLWALLALAAGAPPAYAQVIQLDRPGDREFIVDRANQITPEDEQRIRTICDSLLTDTASPIVIVTIESMAKHTQRNIRSIESFAKILFDQWGIGHLTINGRAANTGILLLVSRDDRKARIELGIGWEYEKEAATQQVMDTVIVPRFRAGDFSGGIRAGVEALDQMVRRGPSAMAGGAASPSAAPSGSRPPLARRGSGGGSGGGSLIGCGGFGLVFIILAIVFIAKTLGRGLGGFGGRSYGGYGRRPGFGTGMLGGLLLGNMLGGRRSSSWGSGGLGGGRFGGGGGFGGGFRGGSFGGGFSGGRGASGSW